MFRHINPRISCTHSTCRHIETQRSSWSIGSVLAEHKHWICSVRPDDTASHTQQITPPAKSYIYIPLNMQIHAVWMGADFSSLSVLSLSLKSRKIWMLLTHPSFLQWLLCGLCVLFSNAHGVTAADALSLPFSILRATALTWMNRVCITQTRWGSLYLCLCCFVSLWWLTKRRGCETNLNYQIGKIPFLDPSSHKNRTFQ